MVDSPLFSSLAERWREIREHPSYSVSDHGKILNPSTGRILKQFYNSKGILTVGLMHRGGQVKKSVPRLVADHFPIPGKLNENFDTPIHLDGDRGNARYDNLMWRPLWMARKYHKQFPYELYECHVPIVDVETGEEYKHTWDAAIRCGLLESDIYLSMANNTYCAITGQIFREL